MVRVIIFTENMPELVSIAPVCRSVHARPLGSIQV